MVLFFNLKKNNLHIGRRKLKKPQETEYKQKN